VKPWAKLAPVSAPHDDREGLPPLRRGAALAASAWLAFVALLYLAVRELGLSLYP